MPKYRDFARQMFEENEEVFAALSEIHAKYQLDQAKWQDEYNRVGEPAMEIVREWEKRLCGYSEKGKFAKYSVNLAEKFRGEIKAFFPLFDFIGAKTSEPVKFVSKPTVKETTVDKDIQEIDQLSLDDFDLPKLY